MNKILDIINEEIDRVISKNIRNISMLLEQDPNALAPAAAAGAPTAGAPAAPAAGAPAAPPAAPEDKDLESLKKKIKSSKDELNIKKQLQSSFEGKPEPKIQDLYSKIISDKELEDKNKWINNFMQDFYPEIIKKTKSSQQGANRGAPVKVNAVPAVPAVVAESKLQKSIKEYLQYKRLYNQIGDE